MISQLSRVYLANLMNWNVVIQEVVVVPHDTAPSMSVVYKAKGHRDLQTALCHS